MDYKTRLKHIDGSCNIVKIEKDAVSYIASQIANNFSDNDIVLVAENQLQIEKIKNQIIYFNPDIDSNYEIITFLPWDCRPYDKNSAKPAIVTNRIKALHKISSRKNKNFIVITTINAILQKIVDPGSIANTSLTINIKDEVSIEKIADILTNNGYTRQSLSYVAGEFSIRGGIIDIVTTLAGENIGYRIDTFGNQIESIKTYDPSSQLSQDEIKEVEILPAAEINLTQEAISNFRNNYRQILSSTLNLDYKDEFYDSISNKRSFVGIEHYLPLFYNNKLTSLFAHLKNSVVICYQDIDLIAKATSEQIQQSYQLRLEDVKINKNNYSDPKPLPPELLYHDNQQIINIINNNTNIKFHNFDCNDKDSRIFDLDFKPVPDFHLAAKTNKKNPLELVKQYSESLNKKTFICASNDNSKNRITNLLHDLNYQIPIITVEIDKGFEAPDLIVISEQAIFGDKINQKKSNKRKNAAKKIIEEGIAININDLIVHRDYGIGRFKGIHSISASGVQTDMVKIEYGNSDMLFIPVEDIDLITRYGDDNPLIQLDRLGVATWKNRKERVKKRIKIAASSLIKTAAARKLKKATIYNPHQHFYEEFKARFGFIETPDQGEAITQIEDDLSQGKPMDRLICGDVGFGKTEVAMRAAFIVASNNYDYDEYLEQITSTNKQNSKLKRHQNISQIAIITPTTILCRQHYKNFSKRFENTDIKIAHLSRLTTPATNKKTKQDLQDGKIDIVIGTHALLSKDIKFKNLALLIVDEEQHFGVAQKERLKEFKNEVHILALSATPIPRTLQMSLTGVKDLSLIATAPIDRLAVRNFVMPFDIVTAKEAITREYQRSGKVFFVTPHIQNIDKLTRQLKKTLPEEINIVAAHGRMTGNEIENIMNDFYDNKIDVLISTTIIESGIDVASANTIIIHKAEMFGLSQLYQLRGRVGRSKTQAYAYFMMSDKNINEHSKKKLKVMQNLDELGVGFSVASHDMDIRGSGDIMGDEQSGHIKETGIELYQQMLLEEIEKMKNKLEETKSEPVNNFEFNPQIKLNIDLSIPEDYIEDLSLRMSFYKKIAKVCNLEEKHKIEDEMLDRFGKVPFAASNLMNVSIIKHGCKKLKIAKIQIVKTGIFLTFKNNKFTKIDQLLALIATSKNLIKITSDHRMHLDPKIIFDNQQQDLTDAKTKISAAFKTLDIMQSL